jgi:hypothetical protein
MHEAAGENSGTGTEAMTLLLLSGKEQFGARGAATILALAAYAAVGLALHAALIGWSIDWSIVASFGVIFGWPILVLGIGAVGTIRRNDVS